MSTAGRQVSLMAELGAGLLPEHEFRSILGSHFDRAERRGRRVVSYLRDDDVAVTARYKDGELIDLQRGPSLTAQDIEAIADRVTAEANEVRECVQRCFVFSIQRVEGFWRFEDRFQLLRAPDDAPDVPFVLAPHPLVLEYKVRMSADGTLLALRSDDTATRLVLLLNAFMRFGLTRTDFGMNPRWVVDAFRFEPTGDSVFKPLLATDGYVLPGFVASADKFSDTEHLPGIPVLADGERYSGDATGPLVLPSWFEAAIYCYSALDEPEQRVFHRALYWFSHSRAMYRVSSSAALAALVQAIEALAPPPGPVDRCPECDLDRAPRATARFRSVMSSVGFDKRTSDGLYEIRSKILYGSRVLRDDLESVFGSGLHPESAEFWLSYDDGERAVRTALLWWLSEKVASKPTG